MKFTKTSVFGLVSVFLLSALSLTCTIGLGDSVDTKAPQVAIAYPPVQSIIRNTFTMNGTASDDVKLLGVTARVVNTVTGAVYEGLRAEIDPVKKTWSLPVNVKDANGVYAFPDGTYQITISATDGANRTTVASTTYEIDNTPPVLVLNRPSTFGPLAGKVPEVYGSELKVTGSVNDDHAIERLEFQAFTAAGTPVATPLTYNNISGVGMELTLAKFFVTPTNQEQTDLRNRYLSLWNETLGGTQSFYATINVSDAAREFNPPADVASASNERGNVSESYYIYDDIYSSVFAASGFNLQMKDLTAIFNNTFADAAKAEQVRAYMETRKKPAATWSTAAAIFSLNPDISPTYTIIGYEPITATKPINTFRVSNESTINVRVSANRDAIPLAPDSIRVTVTPVNATTLVPTGAPSVVLLRSASELTGNAVALADRDAQLSKTGGDYVISVVIKGETAGPTITTNTSYLLDVEGADQDGNIIQERGSYGFQVVSSGNPPAIFVTAPGDLSYTHAASVPFNGTVATDSGFPSLTGSVTYYNKNTGAPLAARSGETQTINIDSIVGNVANWSLTLDTQTGVPLTGTYRADVTLVATDTNNSSTTVIHRIYVDHQAPTAEISSPASLGANVYAAVNGRIDVTLKCSDNEALQSASYTLNGGPSESFTVPANTTITNIDTNNYDDASGTGSLDFVVTVTDTAGNVGTYNGSIPIDQASDRPVIAFNNLTPGESYLANNLGVTRAVSGTIVDDDGVDRAKIVIAIAPDANQDGTPDSAFTPVVVSGQPAANGKSVSWSHNLASLAQGYYLLQVKSGDILYSGTIASEANTGVFSWAQTAVEKFVIDYSAPSITINQAPNEYKSGPFTLSGTAQDDLGLVGDQIQIGGTNVAVDPGTHIWTHTITPAGEGNNSLTITATDNAGQVVNSNFTYRVDTTIPTVSLTTDLSATQYSPIIAIGGSAADTSGTNPSGVARVEYRLNGGSWTSLNGTSTWSGNISVPSGASHTLEIRSVDVAGNTSAVLTRTISMDATAPVVTFNIVPSVTQGGTDYFNGLVDFKAAIQDGSIVQSVYWRVGAAAVPAYDATSDATMTSDGWNVYAGANKNDWTVNDFNTATLTDNTTQYLVVVAVDRFGNHASYNYPLNVNQSTDRPAISFINLTASAAHLSNNLGLSGTLNGSITDDDAVSSTHVYIGTALDANQDGVPDSAFVFNAVSGSPSADGKSVSWSHSISSLTQGYYVLQVKAADVNYSGVFAGEADTTKYSWNQSAIEKFVVDTAPPALTVDQAQNNWRSGTFTLSGTASDGLGLAGNQITVNGTPVPVAAGVWTTSIDTAAAGFVDGANTFTIIATDVTGQSTNLSFTFKRDSQNPTITVTTTHADWKNQPVLTVVGTATDPGGASASGVARIEYSTDGTTWLTLSGTTSWTGSIPVNSGANSLSFRSVDGSGRESTPAARTFNVDLDNPEVSITTPSALLKVRAEQDIALECTVTDTAGGSGVSQVRVTRIGSTTLATPVAATRTAGNEFSGTWQATIPAATLGGLSLTDGTQYQVTVEAIDTSARSGSSSFSIQPDFTMPDVGFTAPVSLTPPDLPIVNKTITVSGTASDTQGLQSVVLSIQHADATWEVLNTFTGSAAFNWSIPAFNTLTYDSATYDTGAAALVQLTLRAVATDAAGNESTGTISFTIDQNSDRPTIKVSNLSVTSIITLKNSSTVYGTVADDDGVSLFECSDDGTAWTTVPHAGGSWSYASTLTTDGQRKLYFRVTDTEGTIFTTDLVNEPYVASNSDTAETFVTYRVDTQAPTISTVINANGSELVNNRPFGGGAGNTITISLDATDLNGIDTVTVSIEGITGAQPTTQSGNTFTTTALSLSALDGYKQVVITARDNSGLESTVTRTILVDNLAPEVKYSSPRMGIDTVNGAVNIVGETVEGGSGMQSVQYALGYDYASRPWTSTGGSLVSWKIEYTNADPIEKAAGVNLASLASASDLFTLAAHGYANGTIVWLGADVLPGNAAYGTPYYVIDSAADTFRLSATSGGASINFSSDGTNVYVSSRAKSLENNIWSLPVLIHATDKAGNSFTSPVEEYLVKVDPSGDKPKVSVTYPETNPSTLGGTIRITGIAEDDDAVQAVYMQIDVNNDGLFTAADVASNSVNWYEAGDGREVTGTSSWRQTINADNEFNPTGTDTIRIIRFRIRAKDIYGVFGGWSDPYVVNIDKNVPQFSAFSLTQGATNRSYVTDMWIRGSWTLTGTVVDESGIDSSSVTVSGTISGGGTSVPYTGAWTMTIHTEGGKTGYRISIPLDTASMSGSVISLQVRASDNSSPQMSASQSFSIQFDNTAPDQLTYGGDVPVVNSNNLYEAKGSVRELGSGYARTLVYLTRDGINAANNRLYDPRLPAANSKLLSALTERDGIPMQTLTVTSSDATSLTSPQLVTNDFVRIGTMVYLDGVYYRITSYDPATGTIGWTEDVPAITEAAVPYALVIDNTTTELPKEDGIHFPYFIENDDGDGLVESVKSSSGLVNWACSFDALYVPDGNITIHYVVFDHAGNYAARTEVTQIRSNPPLLAKVTLGTDLSGNNAIEAAEWVAPFSAKDAFGNDQAIVEVGSGSFKAKALTHVDIDVVGGNGNLKYELTVGGDVIHPLATSTLRVGTTGSINKIPITVAELQAATIGEGLKNFIFTIWDSTEEYVVGTSTYSATLTVPMTVDAVDEVSPEVVISPLYWTDEDDNSLFDFSRDNGHIELSADLDTGTFDSSTALLDIDDKISGKITIRGTAYDDQRLTDLWMYIGNGTNNINKFDFTGAAAVRSAFDFTPTDAYTTTTLSTEYSRMASYSGGAWSVETTTVDTQGWKFTVVSNSLDQSGHTVEWMLEIDTGILPGGPALNRVIRIIAEDKRASGATPQPNASSLTAGVDNIPQLRVDVVPYITEVKTNLSDFYASNASVHSRSALGNYPVGENEVIDIKGYNLSIPATVRLNGVILAAPTLVDGNLQTNIGTAATSGALVVTIGTTESLNDRNNNNAEYNKMPNKVNNNLLTDDVSLDVWGVKHVASPRDGGIIHPEMGIGPNGEIGFAFVNGNFYFNMAGPANAGETFTSGGGTSTWASQRAYEKEYAQYWESAFAFDGTGNTYGMSTNIDVYIGNGNNYSAYTSFYFGQRAGQINPPNGGTQGWNSTPGNYYGGLFRRRLQSTTSTVSAANISDTNPNRAQSPSLATATHGTRTNVYVAYYDAVRKEIRYRYGSVGRSWEKRVSADSLVESNTRITTTTDHDFAVGDLVSFTKQSNAYLPAQAQIDTYTVQSVINDTQFTVNGNITAWVNGDTYVSAIGGQLMDATGGFSSTQGVEAGEGPDDQSVRASMYTVVAGPGLSGKYVSVGVVPGATASADVAVIVWFDAGSKTLKYGYCESPQQDDAVFTVSTIDTAGAWYPKIAVDGSGGIHVAYYGTSGADLKYAYASGYAQAFTTVTVDSFQLVGTQITLDVATDTAENVVPYIGYYSASAQTAKLAYPVSFNTGKPTKAGVANDLYTGFWEVTNVPSDAYTPKDDTICVGVHKEWTGANKGRIAAIASNIGTLSSTDDTDNNYSSRIGGNGTDNPVVGFVVQDDDSLKMAQKK